jgi:hypothetical protein
MITESFQNYKGYTIRLRAVTNNGFTYDIIKQRPNITSPNGIKNIYLKKVSYWYIKPDELLNKAKNYIDNFENNLINKYNKSN